MEGDNKTTEVVIKGFYNVYNTLGYGFLEKVYERALMFELKELGLFVEQQVPITVYYKQQKIGDYFADLLINKSIIIELKACETICEDHEFQLINYLKATNAELGLLFNFGKKPEIRRKIFENKFKRSVQIC